jgi:hypothetical protein
MNLVHSSSLLVLQPSVRLDPLYGNVAVNFAGVS